MKELIKRILSKWGCHHRWEVHNEVNVWSKKTDSMPVRSRQTLICTECGKIKRINL